MGEFCELLTSLCELLAMSVIRSGRTVMLEGAAGATDCKSVRVSCTCIATSYKYICRGGVWGGGLGGKEI